MVVNDTQLEARYLSPGLQGALELQNARLARELQNARLARAPCRFPDKDAKKNHGSTANHARSGAPEQLEAQAQY